MPTKPVERGAVTERVAAGVKAIRERRRWSLTDLQERLERLGRPIHSTGLVKVERGGDAGRRIDVDDLVALAVALGVTPNRLLFGNDLDGELELTPSLSVPARAVWEWACGEAVGGTLDADDGLTNTERYRLYADECRPHHQPMTEERQQATRRAAAAIFEAMEAAADADASIDEIDYLVNVQLRGMRATAGEF